MIATKKLALLLALSLGACTKLGDNYQRPNMDIPASYKNVTDKDKQAAHLATNWWLLFNDPALTDLEEAAIQNNPDLRAAMARVAEARAAARVVQSQYYPQVTLDPAATWTFTGGGSSGSSAAGRSTNNGNPAVRIPFDVSYEVDLWGQVARSLESADAATRATADDFAVVMLTLESDVAQNYMNLRSLESQDDIFTENVQKTETQLDLTKQRFQNGVAGRIDVYQAQTQLDTLKTQQIDIRRQRADTEHALAILTGKAPSEFSMEFTKTIPSSPTIPPGLPADVLRHRPDVAEAEENLVAANAQVGVALTNFYPAVRLTGAAGYESVDVQHTLDWQSAILSFGPSVNFPLFEGGKLTATLDQTKARYEELKATYRSVILGAFRDVEVSLSDVHHREDALEAQHRATEAARQYEQLSYVEYQQGIVSYLQLLDADRTLLTNEITESQLLDDRLVSTVLLIKALGGGWTPDASDAEVAQRPSGTHVLFKP